MGAPALDPDPDEDNMEVTIDKNVLLQSLSQLARTKSAADTIQLLLSGINLRPGETLSLEAPMSRKRTSDGTVEDRRAGEEKARKTKEDNQCGNNVKPVHSAKRKRLVHLKVFECEECDYACASVSGLATHMDGHASSSNTVKYKCALCDKERTGIYHHYASRHNIGYPEQIMFVDGNVLVHSDIDTEGGKAPWFLNEKDKAMKRYTNTTCRLCDVEVILNNTELLADHYTLHHMVEPGLLNNLKQLFRAEKRAHLVNVPASQTPKKKNNTVLTQIQNVSPVKKNEKENIRLPCKICGGTFSKKANLKKHVQKLHATTKPRENKDAKNVVTSIDKSPKHLSEEKNISNSTKYKCAFCDQKYATIYKHYGVKHNIDFPEEILFYNGNVLVFSERDTKRGEAPWFLRERERADRYTPSICRLCETNYDSPGLLEKHYLSDHMVITSSLKYLPYIFRSKKGAHLADMPTSLTPSNRKQRALPTQLQGSSLARASVSKTERKCNLDAKVSSGELNQKPGKRVEEQGFPDLMYQCAECSIATPTYDASVEHAHLHYFEHYKPTTETCDICKFAFEAQCFAEHMSSHCDNGRKILMYHPSNLPNEKWYNIFQGLPEAHANQIKSSSMYGHTRIVKMNSDDTSGIPIYQCGKCDMYVHPIELEDHCHDMNACVKNITLKNHCSECDIFFYTPLALREHTEEHIKGSGSNSFRIITFNWIQDQPVNRVLQKLRSNSVARSNRSVSHPIEESPARTQQRDKQTVEILQNVVVSELCGICNKFVMCADLEAHNATHHNIEKRAPQQPNCTGSSNKEGRNSEDVVPQNGGNEALEDNGGTVEPWNSDNDSCHSLQVSSYNVQIEVHVQKEEVEEEEEVDDCAEDVTDDGMGTEYNSPDINESQQSEVIEIDDDFSEEMTSDLKREFQNLFTISGIDINKDVSVSNEKISTRDLLRILEGDTENESSASSDMPRQKFTDKENNKDIVDAENQNNSDPKSSQDILASDPIESKKDNPNLEISQDIFSETQTQDFIDTNANATVVNNLNKTTKYIENTTVNFETAKDGADENSRLSSRDILNIMLPETPSDLTAVLEEETIKKRIEQQNFINETQRIREIMFSRERD